MTIEELNRLKDAVHEHFTIITADPMTGKLHPCALDEYSPLMRLIDAEIERQSVTSMMTIEELKGLKEWFHLVTGHLPSAMNATSCFMIDALIDAEIERQGVTDEEVQKWYA